MHQCYSLHQPHLGWALSDSYTDNSEADHLQPQTSAAPETVGYQEALMH